MTKADPGKPHAEAPAAALRSGRERRQDGKRRARHALRRSGRGALMLLAALFALAGGIRLGTGVSTAMEHSADPAPPPAPEAASAKGCDASGGLAMPLVEALRAREERVKTLEAALDDRRQALSIADKVVTGKLAALKTAEARLSRTLALADNATEKDVARLTEVYAAMKPKQASAVFEKMAPDFAAGFLGRMPPTAAAAILSGLSPERAYAVSVILAGRNAAAPRD